ncbi:MAG TPA: phosphate/phosphite/phosphonate ABC transporter substrate-binding protein [Gammaproteobacteria bacterium]
MKRSAYEKKIMSVALFMLLSFVSSGGGKVYADESTHYKFGVFPFMPMPALIKYYNSVSSDFTRLVNKRVIAQSRPTYKLFSEEIAKETYDIIFIQPFDYPLAHKHHYRPLARRADDLDAILVVKIDSDINSITDLAGKTLASPPLESAITVVMTKELKKAGLDAEKTIDMIHTDNHFSCMQLVLAGKVDACSTTTPVLVHWEESQLKKKKLKVVHQSGAIPDTLYMAHERVPVPDQEKFKQAILSWDKRPEGKMILKTFAVTSFVEVKDSDYDVIRNFFK